MPSHVVSFSAEDGSLVARCLCGWQEAWTPWDESSYLDYSGVLDMGLAHSLQGRKLPPRPPLPEQRWSWLKFKWQEVHDAT